MSRSILTYKSGIYLTGALMFAATGCQPKNEPAPAPAPSAMSGQSPRSTTQAPTTTELAAYAASRRFPSEANGQNDLHTAAIVNRGAAIIKLYNFDGMALRNVDVWVNQAFVLRLQAVPANGSVEVKLVDMYNAVGRNLASQNEPIRQVQLVIDGALHNTWGPASE